MSEFARALEALLRGPKGTEEELIQTVYIKLKNGKALVFLGAPVTEEDFDQIQDIHIGECVPIEWIGAAQGPRMTAQ